MKKNIIITAGGTSEKIDEVRKITNSSTGKLGKNICEELLTQQKDSIEKIYYICTRKSIQPPTHKLIKVIHVESVSDLQTEIEDIMKSTKIDYFIHSMAISDYTTDYVNDAESLANEITKFVRTTYKIEDMKYENVLEKITSIIKNPTNIMDTTSKVSSNKDNLIIKLKPTEKVISLIKKLQPHTFLVGFKLLNNVDKDELFDVAFKLLRKNRCNLVLANDLNDIKQGNHEGMLVYPEKRFEIFKGKESIAENLIDIMFKRGETSHPKSINVSKINDIDDSIYKEFFETGEKLFKKGFLPTVETGTYGNMSIKLNDSMIITGRNVNKGDLPKNHLINIEKVEEVNETSVFAKVHYKGEVKPSIDTAIHHYIYKNTNHKAIVHVHTDKIFAHIPLTNYNYPCGSKEEMESIIDIIKKDPTSNVIQMYKHGLIIMGENLENCLKILGDLFTNETYIDNLSIYNRDHMVALKEWMKHYKSIASDSITFKEQKPTKFLNQRGIMEFPVDETTKFVNNSDNYYGLHKGDSCVGVLLFEINKEFQRLNFIIYTLDEYQNKKLGIGKSILDILTKIAKNNNTNHLSVGTADDCGVQDYYLNNGFRPVEHENCIMRLVRFI